MGAVRSIMSFCVVNTSAFVRASLYLSTFYDIIHFQNHLDDLGGQQELLLFRYQGIIYSLLLHVL